MKTSSFLSEYDLSTVYYLCSYYMDNADLDFHDKAYIKELQKRVDKLMEVSQWILNWNKRESESNAIRTFKSG